MGAFDTVLLPQSAQSSYLSEGADSISGQLRKDKECPFSGQLRKDKECPFSGQLRKDKECPFSGQLRKDKECPFSGITSSGRVWRKVPGSHVQSVQTPLRSQSQTFHLLQR